MITTNTFSALGDFHANMVFFNPLAFHSDLIKQLHDSIHITKPDKTLNNHVIELTNRIVFSGFIKTLPAFLDSCKLNINFVYSFIHYCIHSIFDGCDELRFAMQMNFICEVFTTISEKNSTKRRIVADYNMNELFLRRFLSISLGCCYCCSMLKIFERQMRIRV